MLEEPTPTPLLRVVKGAPTDEELAALTVVVAATMAASVSPPARPSTWASYWRTHRTPLSPGAGAWRASAFPR